MHSPSDCPFCHPKPQRIVAESLLCLTLLDGFPVSTGHIPSVPRRQEEESEPDRTLEMGNRHYFYFRKDRQDAVANQFGLTPVTATNIREGFFAFCEEMDMAASYKPALLRCLLDPADEDGAVPAANLTLAFRDFNLARKAAGNLVEKPSARMARVQELSEGEIQQLMLQMPFRKFAQRGFLDYRRDLARVRFARAL